MLFSGLYMYIYFFIYFCIIHDFLSGLHMHLFCLFGWIIQTFVCLVLICLDLANIFLFVFVFSGLSRSFFWITQTIILLCFCFVCLDYIWFFIFWYWFVWIIQAFFWIVYAFVCFVCFMQSFFIACAFVLFCFALFGLIIQTFVCLFLFAFFLDYTCICFVLSGVSRHYSDNFSG